MISKWVTQLATKARPSHVGSTTTVDPAELLGWYLRKSFVPGIRGIFWRPRLGKSSRAIFIGTGVRVAYAKYLHMDAFSVLGNQATIMALSQQGVWFGKRVTVRENAWIQCTSHPSNRGVGLWIGDDTYVGPSATFGVGGPIRIGAGCQIGAGVVIISENHATVDGTPSPTVVVRLGVEIGDGCWLGHRVTILDGVTLGEATIVGAGSVVTKSFPAGSKIAGIPARPI